MPPPPTCSTVQVRNRIVRNCRVLQNSAAAIAKAAAPVRERRRRREIDDHAIRVRRICRITFATRNQAPCYREPYRVCPGRRRDCPKSCCRRLQRAHVLDAAPAGIHLVVRHRAVDERRGSVVVEETASIDSDVRQELAVCESDDAPSRVVDAATAAAAPVTSP